MPTLPEHASALFHDLPKPTGAVCSLDNKSCFFLSIPLHKSPARLRTSLKTKLLKCAALACASAALFTITAYSSPNGTVQPGETVTMQVGEGLALTVEKPSNTRNTTQHKKEASWQKCSYSSPTIAMSAMRWWITVR